MGYTTNVFSKDADSLKVHSGMINDHWQEETDFEKMYYSAVKTGANNYQAGNYIRVISVFHQLDSIISQRNIIVPDTFNNELQAQKHFIHALGLRHCNMTDSAGHALLNAISFYRASGNLLMLDSCYKEMIIMYLNAEEFKKAGRYIADQVYDQSNSDDSLYRNRLLSEYQVFTDYLVENKKRATEKEQRRLQFFNDQGQLDSEKKISYDIFVFILVFLLFVILFAFWFNYFRLKAIKKNAQLEKELNRYKDQALSQQLNPHFIFNTLTSIQYFVSENDSAKSEEYLGKFSKLMRMTLESSRNGRNTIEEELSATEIYINLEILRAKNKFSYSILSDEDIMDLEIPSFFIQPFIENAIWHGFKTLDRKGHIDIRFSRKGDTIMCSVKDNGIGRKKANELKENSGVTYESRGTGIIQNRLTVMNALYGTGFKLEYKDLISREGIAEGTEVLIDLPIL